MCLTSTELSVLGVSGTLRYLCTVLTSFEFNRFISVSMTLI